MEMVKIGQMNLNKKAAEEFMLKVEVPLVLAELLWFLET